MGNAAGAQGGSGTQVQQKTASPVSKTTPTTISTEKKDDTKKEEKIEATNTRAPTLTYMSCMKVFDKGNLFTREVAQRKTAKFPMGKQPTPEWIFAEMQQEWCRPDTQEAWDYCTNPVPHDKEKRLDPYKIERDKGNEGMTLMDFLKKPTSQKAKLEKHEVLSLRLYTGPGYSVLNGSLRKVEMRFAITSRVISIAIVKITDAIGRAKRCYRGMSIDLAGDYKEYYNKMQDELLSSNTKTVKKSTNLPGSKAGGLVGGLMSGLGKVVDVAEKVVDTVIDVAKHNWERVEGFVGPVPFDPAPLSFTTKLGVVEAFTYGKETGITLCFVEKDYCRKETAVLKIGVGADVDWVSQYPTEAEILFPPFTAMLPYALEHRQLSEMSKSQADDVVKMVTKPKQFVFMPVTYCCWNTQWDSRDFRQKAQNDRKNFQ